MPINVFCNSCSSYDNGNKIDTSLFVQKPYLRTNYMKSNIEEDIDLKNQFRIKNLPDPISIREAVSKYYVDNLFNDQSIKKNTDHVDVNVKNLDNVRFIKVNSTPAVGEHLTAKNYVDYAISNSVDESSLLRLDLDEQLKLDEQDSIVLNSNLTSPKTIIELPTIKYNDCLHESSRNKRDLSSVFNDQDNEFDNNNITDLDSVSVKRNPTSDNELSNKKYIEDELDRNLILLLNLVEPDILKRTKFTGHEIDIIKNIALEKLHRQRLLKETIAMDLLEKQFSD